MPGATGVPPDGRRCPARSKKTGERCSQWLPVGWKVCRFHGGGAPQHRAAAARRRVEIEVMAEFERIGTPIVEADAISVLRGLVQEWAGNVVYWRQAVQRIQEAGTPESSDPVFPHKASTIYERYAAACDRAAHYSKLATEAGLDEAETELVNARAEVLVKVLRVFTERMGLANDPRAPAAMRAALTLVQGEIEESGA